ncbi:hypothetical protein BCR33DRAFT_847954 [Rhizoclosmatium globosum]|uniref:Transmembrane protein 135 N-terminal domain-containing protein n=1 Tax=Rhizoclosmatium globosum TaxID=329046 RepID=A0A1Y2CNF0_9FUNG|nr:hypothetical protein BCR33DRAFT_847954 [Rhizoclosmatium globosum]|eukprot:ORY48568.1 hypothetical protein BCR33DRAFT_847954 [Rhizoclosmatium globosum]
MPLYTSTDDLTAGQTPPPPPLSRRGSAHALVRHVSRRGWKSILGHAARTSLRAALLGYSIRSGLLFLLRLLRVYKGKLPVLKALRESFAGRDSARMAAFFAIFAFVWKASNNAIIAFRDGKDDHINSFLSGSLAGALACLAEEKQWRIDMSQQLLVRGLQSVFNSLSLNGHFHFRHGNSLIFALATAQVMYGYVMRPGTIPNSYYRFILNTGPIPEDILLLARQQLGGTVPMDVTQVMKAVVNHKGTALAIEEASKIQDFPDFLPCGVLHPPLDSCDAQMGHTFGKVMKAILPVYASLNFVPMVVLKTRELVRRPQSLLIRGLKNTFRSSLFLAVFVATFMRIACVFRELGRRGIIPRDSRYYFWLNGFISSAAIFIEDEKRRSELAMYVLPRGVDALYQTLYSKSLIFRVPHFEVGMFSAAMGLIIMYFQTEPEALGGIIYRLLRRVDLTIEDADAIIKEEKVVDDDGEHKGKDVKARKEKSL